MITKEDLIKAREMWEKLKKAGQLDIDQANIYIEAVNKRIEEEYGTD